MSVRAVHCISGQKKVFPQTLPCKPSWVPSNRNGFRFGKYVKTFCFRAHNSESGKRRKLTPGQTRKLRKLATSLLKSHFLRISRIERQSNFFLFCQNIPLGKLIQEKIIQSSNEVFNGRKFKKFEKCIKWRFQGL